MRVDLGAELARAEAATSEPIQPAPITTTVLGLRGGGGQGVGVAAGAQVVDAGEVGPGQRRGAAARRPVASSSRS